MRFPTGPHPLQVLVADDDVCVATAISRLLASTFEVQPPVNSLRQLKSALSACPPHVVLLDIGFGHTSSLGLLPELVEAYPSTSFIAFTGRSDPGLEEAALARGAARFLRKCTGVRELQEAIRAVAAECLKGKRRRSSLGQQQFASASLTSRTLAVISLLEMGLTHAEAAARLGLSKKAIEYHVARSRAASR